MTDTPDDDPEITAISMINAALSRVEDPDARRRVLNYVLSRFVPDLAPASRPAPHTIYPVGIPSGSAVGTATIGGSASGQALQGGEFPGVARMSDSGDLKITARDLKAKSGLDAAVRLAHIAIYAHERLTGQPLSSRKGL